MSRFQIYLNGEQVASPKDWSGYDQEVVRDYKKRFLRVTYPATFTLTNESGYASLRALFESDICGLVRFEAYELCGAARYQVCSGSIVLTDCEWDLDKCTVDIEVQDDGIGERIDNNVRIPVSPLAENSKNGAAIQPALQMDIEVFDPSDAEADYLAPTRGMFDWFDAMEHCLRYMTDGNVTVVSEWYEALPDDQRIAIVNGYQLRTGDTAVNSQKLTYDFNAIWLEIANRYNLWMCVRRNNAGQPFISIEPEQSSFTDESSMTLLHQPGVIQSIDTERMYSAIEVGDEDGIANVDLQYSLPYLILQGFSSEKFHFQGVCNIDEVLDLRGKWHADTNTIEKVLIDQPLSDDYDKDTFIIQYNRYNMRAVKSAYLIPESVPYLYNEQMLNVNILNRYALPSDVGSYFNSQGTGFRASGFGPGGWGAITSPSFDGILYFPFPVLSVVDSDVTTPPNENPTGTWDVATQRFTAPAQGYYEFEFYMQHTAENLNGSVQSGVSVVVEHYDVSNTLLSSTIVGLTSGFNSETRANANSIGLVMNTGDYITRTYTRFAASGNFLSYNRGVIIQPLDHYTRTKFVAAGGGVLTSVDPDAARIVKYEYERYVTTGEWNELVNDPRRSVLFSRSSQAPIQAHVMKCNRDVVTGKASFTLLAKKSTI